MRWLHALASVGALEPVNRGVYLNRFAGPTVHPAEAAQFLRRGAIVSLACVLERCGAFNTFGSTVTCVVPLTGAAPPKVGERHTRAGAFRFYAMPQRALSSGAERIGDVQDLAYGYPRATPERALLGWVYLGASQRSRLSLPPNDLDIEQMSPGRLKRLARAMGIEAEWNRWRAACAGEPANRRLLRAKAPA